MAALVRNGGGELRAQVAKVVKLLLRQHRLRMHGGGFGSGVRAAARRCTEVRQGEKGAGVCPDFGKAKDNKIP